jgi:CDP-glucose 4,6-dehydratase
MVNKFRNPDSTFWTGKKVLVTGHTGFKGSWLTLWLSELGAHVIGASNTADITNPNNFSQSSISELCDSRLLDITNRPQLCNLITETKPDVIFHLAAQSLVYEGYQEPHNTFFVNFFGTLSLIESIRELGHPRVNVIITTDKVYRNNGFNQIFSENDTLGGVDPYSASKAASEILIESYRSSFFDKSKIALASARAGNVIGGGDWSPLRIMPDIVRSRYSNSPLLIRNPQATRPWQYVLDPLCGYLLFAEDLYANPQIAQPLNFGPIGTEDLTVGQIIEKSQEYFKHNLLMSQQQESSFREESFLRLDSTKARELIDWQPRINQVKAIEMTLDWYSAVNGTNKARGISIKQIKEFERYGVSLE